LWFLDGTASEGFAPIFLKGGEKSDVPRTEQVGNGQGRFDGLLPGKSNYAAGLGKPLPGNGMAAFDYRKDRINPQPDGKEAISH
jgi:hypothetical protein